MIKTRVLLKAMSFMFMPTLAVLVLLFLWFLDWTQFKDFITSNGAGAGALRIFMTFVEMVFIVVMYNHYLKEDVALHPEDYDDNKKGTSSHTSCKDLFSTLGSSSDNYKVRYINSKFSLIERIPYTSGY